MEKVGENPLIQKLLLRENYIEIQIYCVIQCIVQRFVSKAQKCNVYRIGFVESWQKVLLNKYILLYSCKIGTSLVKSFELTVFTSLKDLIF